MGSCKLVFSLIGLNKDFPVLWSITIIPPVSLSLSTKSIKPFSITSSYKHSFSSRTLKGSLIGNLNSSSCANTSHLSSSFANSPLPVTRPSIIALCCSTISSSISLNLIVRLLRLLCTRSIASAIVHS